MKNCFALEDAPASVNRHCGIKLVCYKKKKVRKAKMIKRSKTKLHILMERGFKISMSHLTESARPILVLRFIVRMSANLESVRGQQQWGPQWVHIERNFKKTLQQRWLVAFMGVLWGHALTVLIHHVSTEIKECCWKLLQIFLQRQKNAIFVLALAPSEVCASFYNEL